MPGSDTPIDERVAKLHEMLVEQGEAVHGLVERAVRSIFEKDADAAARVITDDEAIDNRDIEIERHAVSILSDAVATVSEMTAYDLRMILTIVKVNNELERIADLAVGVAERIEPFRALSASPPAKFEVMGNSIIGIVSNTKAALGSRDVEVARIVLATDDATEMFRNAILREVEESLAAGEHTPDYALTLSKVAYLLGRIADHCTNVAEQVIYVETGKIVRHMDNAWSEPMEPTCGDAPGG
ncbi:MAG: phosphate signaling complex protein PhoU [Planctomycetota bacterium]